MLKRENRIKISKTNKKLLKQDRWIYVAKLYFGKIALFDEAPLWDSAIALQNSVLLSLEEKRFISLISQRPQIILEICRLSSMRLRKTKKYISAKKRN